MMLNDQKYKLIVNEWFARLDKGYAVPPYTQTELEILENILNTHNISSSELITESAGNFPNLIQKEFQRNGLTSIPAVTKKYQLTPGKLVLNSEDAKNFDILFKVKPSGDVGYGEVALFWLFNYNNPQSPADVAQESRVGGGADLIINGFKCEVKAYKSHNSPIKLGVFESSHSIRKIINSLFGVVNLTSTLTGKKPYLSEGAFNYNDLRIAYTQILEVANVLLDPDIQQVLGGKTSIFSEFARQVNEVLQGSADSPEELAKQLLVKLAAERLKIKTSESGGYLINVLPNDSSNIMIFEIPGDATNVLMSKQTSDISSGIIIKSGNVYINYNLFNKG